MTPIRLAVLSAVPLLAGCLSCTEIGCLSGLTFAIDLEKEGAWAFQVETDDAILDCEVELPLETSQSIDCDDGLSSLQLDPVDGGGYVGTLVLLGQTPETASLSAYLDGSLVEELTETPEYEAYYPNGERCDRDSPCLSAVIDVTLE